MSTGYKWRVLAPLGVRNSSCNSILELVVAITAQHFLTFIGGISGADPCPTLGG